MPRRILIGSFALALLLTACGGSESTDTSSTITPATAAAPQSTATEAAPQTTTTAAEASTSSPASIVAVSDSGLGQILVDGEGRTLYMFVPDDQSESTCYDACAANWPALVGTVTPSDGVDQSLIGSTTRTDGQEQVTYNGWPLYYFANDTTAGDTNGQGINDVWYVLTPHGDVIQ